MTHGKKQTYRDTNREAIVLITARAGYPNGTGATARLHTWASGLRNSGIDPWIVLLKASEPSDGTRINHNTAGCNNGIRYQYVMGQVTTKSSLLGKAELRLKGWVGLIQILLRIKQEQKVAAILYYTPEHWSFLLLAWILSRIVGAKLIGERTEANISKKRLSGYIFERTAYRLFDGFVVISSYLHKHIEPKLNKQAFILRIPIMVNTAVFTPKSVESLGSRKTVAYAGAMHKDEAKIVMHVFAKASRGMKNWELKLIGRLTQQRQQELEALARDLRILDHTTFTHHIPREHMPELLCEAAILILPRASGKFSAAGFPTKLGEYLSVARPVVVTNTGDIPLYLEDGVNAYLVEPDNWVAFANRLRAVMQDETEAGSVGRAGRLTALRHFDHREACRRLLAAIGLSPSRLERSRQ